MGTQIKGLDGISAEQLNQDLARGGKFVIFGYAVSVIIMSFKRSSDIYYIRPGESTISKSIPYTLLSLLVGWWGIPFGPIFTIWVLITNFGGGKDVTAEVVNSMNSAT